MYTNAFYTVNKNRQENTFGEVLWATFLSEHEEKFVIPRKEN